MSLCRSACQLDLFCDCREPVVGESMSQSKQKNLGAVAEVYFSTCFTTYAAAFSGLGVAYFTPQPLFFVFDGFTGLPAFRAVTASTM